MDFSRVMPNHRQLLLSERRGYRPGCYKILTRSEVELNRIAERKEWVRHKSTAFPTGVGGRAFQEAVGRCVWEWKTSLAGLAGRVNER